LKTKFRIRLILSVLMLSLTAITLTTSTFAWFATNRNAWFDEIELEIGNTDSLLVSVDGVSYRSSIPSDMVKRAVVAKKKNIPYNNRALDQENFIQNEWKKLSLEPITTTDLKTYKGVDKKYTYIEDGITYFDLQEVKEETNYSYLEFDVWFRVDASKTANKNYDLKLVTDEYIEQEKNAGNTVSPSYITGTDSEVLLYNNLNTQGKEDDRTGKRADGTEYQKGKYVSGDKLKVNCRDAMRLGITRLEQKNKEDIEKFIFEPYEGLGSYALSNYIDTIEEGYYKYDPNKNAMYTYFNNLNEAKLKPLDNEEFDFVAKIHRNGLKDDISLGEIVPNDTSSAYTTIKFTISVWLEGYDADYIVGMYNTSLKMYLNFYVEEKK